MNFCVTVRCQYRFTKTPYPFHIHVHESSKEGVLSLKPRNIAQTNSPVTFVCNQSVSNSITVGVLFVLLRHFKQL